MKSVPPPGGVSFHRRQSHRAAYARARPLSRAQLLSDQARDLAAVGGALGLAHHGADDRTDCLGAAAAGSASIAAATIASSALASDSISNWRRSTTSSGPATDEPGSDSVCKTSRPLAWLIRLSATMRTTSATWVGSTSFLCPKWR